MIPLSRFSLRKWFSYYGYGFLLYLPFILPFFSVPGSASANIRNGNNEQVTLTITVDGEDNSGNNIIKGELLVKLNSTTNGNRYVILPFRISLPHEDPNSFLNLEHIPCHNNNYTLIKIPPNTITSGSTSSINYHFFITPSSNLTTDTAFLRFINVPTNGTDVSTNGTDISTNGTTMNNEFFLFSYNVSKIPAECYHFYNQIISLNQFIYLSNIKVRFNSNQYSFISPINPQINPPLSSWLSVYNHVYNYILNNIQNDPDPIVANDYSVFMLDSSSSLTMEKQYTYTSANSSILSLILPILSHPKLIISFMLVLLEIILIFLGIINISPKYESILLRFIVFIFTLLTIVNLSYLIFPLDQGTIISNNKDNQVSFMLYGAVFLSLIIYWLIRKPSIQELRFGPTIPVQDKYFLNKSDREWIITTVNTIVEDMPVEGMKNLLRDILPNETIDRINFHEGSRNTAERMVARLEQRGALDSGDYALGKFLVYLIDTDKVNLEVAVRLQAILSGYKLLKNNRQISARGSRLQMSY